jgi:hypothetical protein
MSSLRIWKWPLKMNGHQDLNLPAGAQLLTLQLQGGNPTLWALCDTDAPLQPRRFAIYGTGQTLPEPVGQYLGTFQAGMLVWHVFEIWHPISPLPQRIDL